MTERDLPIGCRILERYQGLQMLVPKGDEAKVKQIMLDAGWEDIGFAYWTCTSTMLTFHRAELPTPQHVAYTNNVIVPQRNTGDACQAQ